MVTLYIHHFFLPLPSIIINSARSRHASHGGRARAAAGSIVIPRLLRSPRGSNDAEERSSLKSRLQFCYCLSDDDCHFFLCLMGPSVLFFMQMKVVSIADIPLPLLPQHKYFRTPKQRTYMYSTGKEHAGLCAQ